MKQQFVFFVLASLFVVGYPANAQQRPKTPGIGELVSRGRDRPGLGTGRELFRRSLRELGYIEGKTISYETRSSEGNTDRFPALAEELVRLKVDVLVASSMREAIAFRKATQTTPIVYIGPGDPVATGLVDSLARPGGNITGFTTMALVLAGKRLELLRETVPKVSRVGVLWNPRSPGSQQIWKVTQQAARAVGLQLYSMKVSRSENYMNAFKEAVAAGSTSLLVRQTPPASANRKLIADLAAKHRLPSLFDREDFVQSGGLMSYGSDWTEPYRRGALMVDKILRGAKPSDLPVEQPTKFELVINLKTAKQIGLTIPPNVLARADRVIR